jgi:tetratricopeptide (TPR) repeat protein
VTVNSVDGFGIQPGELVVGKANQEDSSSLGLLKIQRALLLGNDGDALAEADRLISADSQNADALIAKGDILMSQDKPDDALEFYDQALEIQMKSGDEPLFLEERRSAAFSRSLEKRGVLLKTNQPLCVAKFCKAGKSGI